MLFENASTWSEQGDIGEARAVYEYTKLGYSVSKPLNDNSKYDLIIDDGESLKRVQIKTSKCRSKEYGSENSNRTGYHVNLATKGGNSTKNTIRAREENDYDILFVLTEDERCWSIPVEHLAGRHSIRVGATGNGAKYGEFEITKQNGSAGHG